MIDYNMFPEFAQGGEMIRRKDGSYSRRGLWDNIRANKGSGKKPTKEMLEQERKIKASEKYPGGGNVDAVDIGLNVLSYVPGPIGMYSSGAGLGYDLMQDDYWGAGANLLNIATMGTSKALMAGARTAANIGARNAAAALAKGSHVTNRAGKIVDKVVTPYDSVRNTFHPSNYIPNQQGGYRDNTMIKPIVYRKHGGAVDLNAFYNQPRYIQTNIYKDGGEPDGSMALTQINAMMDRLSNLQKFIQQDSDLDPWISDKISVMNHSATAINDYMMYGDEGSEEETMEMKNGGGIPERYKNMGFSRVGQKKESNRDGKKWMVLAKKGDDYKVVHGGYDGMKDYTQHGSEKRRDRFWDRMGGRDSAKAKDPFSPLYWHKRFGTWQDGGELPMAAYGIDPPGLVPPLPTGTPLYYGEVNSGSPYPIVPIPVSGTPFEAPVVKPSRPKPLFKVDDNLRSGAPVTPPLPMTGTPIVLPQNKLSQYAWTANYADAPKPPAPVDNTSKTADGKTTDNKTNGLWNNKTYDALSMMALLPLGNRGLAGLAKGLIGTAGFVGGVGTGMDNIYRGFQPRQEKGGEIPRYEMAGTAMGKPVTNYDPLGLMDPEEQKRKWGLDPTGVARMMGAATGLGMMNDVIGYNQNMRNFERNQVRTGMSDMMGVSNPFMPQGYDVLNTGPGQTQAPNMYTPVQFAGNRMPGFFEEGGEYEMTEDELQQFLAMGGQVEYI